jgi:hypothetical protein
MRWIFDMSHLAMSVVWGQSLSTVRPLAQLLFWSKSCWKRRNVGTATGSRPAGAKTIFKLTSQPVGGGKLAHQQVQPLSKMGWSNAGRL